MAGPATSNITDADVEAVRRGERALMQAHVRASPDEVAALLADDFAEFGRSGHTFDKAATIAGLRAEGDGPRTERDTLDLTTRAIEPDAVLVTHTAVRRTPRPAEAT